MVHIWSVGAGAVAAVVFLLTCLGTVECQPTFMQSSYQAKVSEGAHLGTFVIRVEASSPSGGITYFLDPRTTGLSFDIGQTNGTVVTKDLLDRETRDFYNISVIAQDFNGLQSTVPLAVRVTDINDHSPDFQLGLYTSRIDERAAGVYVRMVSAVDFDEPNTPNSNITYALGSEPDAEYFSLDPVTGNLTTKVGLDYERKQELRFLVVARDAGTQVREATSSVIVTVRNVMENLTESPTYPVQIPETTAIGDVILTIAAKNGVVPVATFHVVDGMGKFAINATSGELRVTSGLIGSGQDVYNLSVYVEEGDAYRQRGDPVPVTVTVLRNSGKVFFASPTANVTIPADTAPGFVFFTARANDTDTQAPFNKITYSFCHGSRVQGYFEINSTTGATTLKESLFNDSSTSFQVCVQAEDGGGVAGSRATLLLTVQVQHNLHSPRFLNHSYSATLREDLPMASSVFQVLASDADAKAPYNTMVFTLAGDANTTEFFTINADDGTVTVKKDLRMSTQTIFKGTVTVRDDAPIPKSAATSANFSITVVRNEFSPLMNASFIVTVSVTLSVGSVVIDVRASDRDVTAPYNQITYSLSGNSEALATLQINSATGRVTLKRNLTTSATRQYLLLVRAEDGGFPPKAATSVLTVNVLTNRNAPVFGSTTLRVPLLENAPIGTTLTALQAADNDLMDPDNVVSYHLTSVVPSSSLFSLDSTSGALILARSITSLSPSLYTLTAVSRDGGTPSLQSANVTILVTVTFNTSPRFDPSQFNTTVRQDAPLGSLVGRITAVDNDTVTPFNVLTYAIIGDGNAPDYFQIHSSSGNITIRDLLVRDTSLVYRLRIVATDGGGLSATATATVSVLRNLNRPELQQQNYTQTILENQALSTPIVTVSAIDRDVTSPHRDLQFRIVGNAQAQQYFSINNGQIVLIRSPADDPSISTFNLEVQVSDQGLPTPLTADRNAFVTVTVLRNANPPIFFNSTYEITIEETQPISTSIIRVTANDADTTPPFNTLQYRATGDGSAPFYFRVSSSTGEVFINNTLRGVPIDRFTLRIEAQDSGTPPRFASAIVYINVRRNFFPPQFIAPSYNATILETRPVLDTILTVSATDNDATAPHSSVYYELSGDVDGQYYFQVSETGAVSVRRPLTSDALRRNRYSLTLKALDRGTPQLTSTVDVSVTINVQRNNNPPRFVNEPYIRTLTTQATSGTVVTVRADDLDPPGTFNTVKYSIDGPEGAQNLWSIDENTGAITARSPATINNALDNPYYITVKAVDNGVPPFSDSTVVTLTINRNQFAPSFAQANYNVTIQETQSIGNAFLTVTATDQDTMAPNNDLVYEAVSPSTLFSVSTFNNRVGQLFVSGNLLLDRTTNQYIMLVAAVDRGAFPLRSTNTATVTINVLRNSFTPEFQKTPYSTRILQTANPGSTVLTVTAVDRDTQNPYNVVTYQIIGSTAPGRFNIDPSTGRISLAQSIQTDSDSEYIISVSASDGGSPSRVAYETVRVTVDRNLFDPEWTNPGSLQSFTASTSVLETIDFAFLVYNVTARDRDQSSPYNTLTYSIVGEGSASTYFNINPDNGEIRLKSSLLQDTQESYRILVKVTDRGSPPRSATATVTINVGVVRNKEGPVFINTPYTSLQNENIGVGTLITTVTARDNDPSPFNQVTYDVTGDEEAPVYFNVNRNTGAVSLLRSVAGETKTTYLVRTRACDNGNPPKCNSTALIITINRNLFTPEFTQTQYDVTIPETQNLGVPIVTLNARDQDTSAPHSQLVFRAVQDGSAALQYFQVDPSTGQISVRLSLISDLTASAVYTMRVQVGDNGIPQRNSTILASVRISVQRNRSPPVFIGSPYNVTIREDATISSSVVRIFANDTDVDSPFNNVSLSVIGDNKGPLYFNLNNTIVRTSRDLSTDTDTIYTLRLLASDGGQPSKTATALVYVTVTRNLFSPVFQPNSYTATIPESQDLGVGFGLTVTATDNDRNSPYNSVRYEISTNAASSLGREYFLINPVSGLVTVRKDLRLDTQSRTTYTFQVDAFDGEGRPAAQPASVTVTVNRNQFPPVFTNPSSLVSLNYTAPLSTQVFDADATDADKQAPNNVVSYYIIGDDDATTYFGINESTGAISLRQSLRNNGISQFKIRVEARDGGSPFKSNQRLVSVNVLRNFNAPVFSPANRQISILETAPVQSFVTQVSAVDSDLEPPNNQVTYNLVNDFFLVESATGRILVRQSVIGNNQSSYNVTVTAVDGGSPQLSAQVQVTVNIQRNQFDPVFQNLPYSASKRSDAQVGESIITVFANDSDTVSPFNVVKYDIIGDDNAPGIFRINSANGQITMQSTFANDPSEIYRIRVRAQDGGSPPKSAVAMVTVNVRRNLFEPEFLTTTYNQRILETADIGSSVLTVTARDSDNSAPNNALDFSLVGDARCQEYFLINSVSGVVAVRKYLALDPTTTNPTNFQCTVSVRDRGTPSLQGRNNASLSIAVVRNQPPAFINTPYSGTVVRTVSNLTRVTSYTVVDSDTDTPFNSVTVTAIGDGSAPNLFSLNGNDIIVTNPKDLAADNATTYTLRLVARDGGSTSRSATATAVISVHRNLNPPVFVNNSTTVNVTEKEVVGTVLANLTAIDSDPPGPNSAITFSAEGEGVAPTYLYVNPKTGAVHLMKSLESSPQNSLRLLVDARDAGFPVLTARATVLVNIIRDVVNLTFSLPSYNTTISETKAVNSLVVTVFAMPAPAIEYRLVGYSDGPDYFNISATTGEIFVKKGLREDPARKTVYELRVEVSKQFTTGKQTVVKPVFITVVRNANAPDFDRPLYSASIKESLSLGSSIIQLNATDIDGDTLTYSLVNSPGVTDYFYLGLASGLLSLRLPLTGFNTSRFQFEATVSDNALTNARTRTVTIIVNVLRDTQPPQFINEPYRTVINFNTAVGSVALTVTATDSDLVGRIVYEARGGYLAAPYFFQVDRTTGQITLRNSVALDMTVTEYTLGVIAYDDASPGLTATSNVTITINRNPSVPVMAANQYTETVPETQQLGVTILTVSATDADQQALTYRIQSASPTGCDASYLLGSSSGTIVAIRPLQNATDDVCRMNVAATDAGTPPSTSVPVSVTISIIRNRNGPLFAGLFETSIPETAGPGTNVIQVTATDADQGYAPFRTLTYELIGDDQTPGYLSINRNTGNITLQRNLLFDDKTIFIGRVRAQDGGSPPRSATAIVRINILRNLNSPSFANPNYNLTILETESLTTILTTVVATDADRQGPQNTITYQMVDTNSGNLASTYFRVTTSGQIYVRSPLTGSSISTVTFEVQAQDAGVPVRQSNPNARVTITVIRNQFPPVFQGEPYNTSLPFTTGPSVSVYTVSATDADTRDPFNLVRYSLIGDDKSPAMFTIDPVSGQINTRTSLGTDILERYVLRVVAADGGTPSLTDTSTVVVTVQRNLNSPEVFPQNYTVTILEEQALGVPVIRVSASDRDVSSPHNQLVYSKDTALTDAETQEFFSINAASGDVFVGKALILSSRNRTTDFVLAVQVCDAGNPPRCAPQRAFVTIRVIRNRNTPYFINLPIDRSLQTLQVGSVVTTATARDDDDARYKYGQVTYSLIGDDGAPAVFQIDSTTGAVRVLSSPITSGDLFRIRIQACDGGNLCNTTVAIISLRTNFLAPEFSPLPASYQRTVPETITLGEVILDLNATDRDPTAPNNALSYTITSGPEDQACFQINPFTGEISARRSLLADPCAANIFNMIVTASDGGSPSLSATATVSVFVSRNLNSPVFQSEPYQRQLNETTAVNTTVLTVTATDADVVSPMNVVNYEIVGEGTAPNFFRINTAGQITVSSSLLNDMLTSYTLRVRAYDGGSPAKADETAVTVTVNRNLHSPVISPSSMSVSVLETQLLGDGILSMTATDGDYKAPYNQVEFELQGSDCFSVDKDTGAIFARRSLMAVPCLQETFTMNVTAWDLGSPRRSSLPATVTVGVLRNRHAPVFQNATYRMIISRALRVAQPVLNITATDADTVTPFNNVTYRLLEDSVAMLYFNIDANTGQVLLSRALTQAPGEMMVTVEARDGGMPPKLGVATVYVTMQDSVTTSPTTASPGSTTGSLVGAELGLLIGLIIVLGMLLLLIIIVIYLCVRLSRSLKDSRYLSPTTEPTAPPLPMYGQSGHFNGPMSGYRA